MVKKKKKKNHSKFLIKSSPKDAKFSFNSTCEMEGSETQNVLIAKE